LIEPLPAIGLTDPAHEAYRQRYVTELRDEAEAYLTSRAESLRAEGFDVSVNVVYNVDPASGIVSEAEKAEDTLIAMSSHGRSGITRWLLGSVTDRVFRVADSALLVARVRDDLPATAKIELDKIILPVDGSQESEDSLPGAAELSRLLGLKIVLLEIVPTGEASAAGDDLSAGGESDLDYLAGVERRLLREGATRVERRRIAGDPAEGIVSLAQELSNNLVVMASHRRSGLERMVPGSVTDRVVRNAGDPVLVVEMKQRDTAQ
jgi:nucleotide-binding universal stress UspA family protein